MKLTLEPGSYEGISITQFYEFVAVKANLKLEGDYTFDCRKINVSKDIQDALFKYMEENGYSQETICMMWCVYGPKAFEEFPDNTVELLDGFVNVGDEQ